MPILKRSGKNMHLSKFLRTKISKNLKETKVKMIYCEEKKTRTSEVCTIRFDEMLNFIYSYICKLTKYFISGMHEDAVKMCISLNSQGRTYQ